MGARQSRMYERGSPDAQLGNLDWDRGGVDRTGSADWMHLLVPMVGVIADDTSFDAP